VADVTLAADVERIFEETDALCRWLNVAIIALEHVLAVTLMALQDAGCEGLPDGDNFVQAAVTIHGMSEEPLGTTVMWGSAAREAMSATVRATNAEGASVIDAKRFALGIITSGELHPGFFEASGTTRDEVVAAVQDYASAR
jgi:hypothetical protein